MYWRVHSMTMPESMYLCSSVSSNPIIFCYFSSIIFNITLINTSSPSSKKVRTILWRRQKASYRRTMSWKAAKRYRWFPNNYRVGAFLSLETPFIAAPPTDLIVTRVWVDPQCRSNATAISTTLGWRGTRILIPHHECSTALIQRHSLVLIRN